MKLRVVVALLAEYGGVSRCRQTSGVTVLGSCQDLLGWEAELVGGVSVLVVSGKGVMCAAVPGGSVSIHRQHSQDSLTAVLISLVSRRLGLLRRLSALCMGRVKSCSTQATHQAAVAAERCCMSFMC